MFYNLAAAATATGLTRTIILKAIKSGTIFATKDELGEWRIDVLGAQRFEISIAQLAVEQCLSNADQLFDHFRCGFLEACTRIVGSRT